MTIAPISVLIPTMNRPQALKRTIDGYMSADVVPSQIVIVDQSQDNGMASANRELLDSYISETQFEYIYQEVPSLTKARNCAFACAREEVIICSDDDVDVYFDTLKNIQYLMADEKLAMIAGLDDNMKPSQSKIGYLLGTKSFKYRNIGHVTLSVLGRFPEKIEKETATMWAMGFFFVIRKSLMMKWNTRWDEALTGYAYPEDLDFSFNYYKHATDESYNCIMTPNVSVSHLASQEYRTPSRKSTFMYVLNRAYLCHKHHMGWKSEVAMRWCNFWMYIHRIIHSDSPRDFKDAVRYLRKHKFEVRNGNINSFM